MPSLPAKSRRELRAARPAASPPVPRHGAPAPASGASPRHGKNLKRHAARRRLGAGALALVLFLGTGATLAYSEIQGNVTRHDISDMLGEPPAGAGEPAPIDQKAGQPLNLLVMGSDVRTGDSDVDGAGAVGAVGGMRSDTTMIAHISADRTRVEVVSIPRDTLVDVPSCIMPSGAETAPQSNAMFNSAFSIGGQTGDVGAAAACTIRTVQELTGIAIDDFVVVDFAGFMNMVNALDGVPMDIPEPGVDDAEAQLQLAAGCQVLDGRQALGYARARYSLGDGSDIDRIGRQQELVAAIAREALSKNLLTDLPSLYQFLDASTSTLTTGVYIGGLPTMAGLASSLRGIALEDILFTTMPFDWAGPRVTPAAEADALWAALAADQPIEATLSGAGDVPETPATAAPGDAATPPGDAATTPADAVTTDAPATPDAPASTDATPGADATQTPAACSKANAA